MSSDQASPPGPKRGIPQIFGVLIVFGLLTAGVLTMVGFAIDKDAKLDSSASIDPANAAAAEQYESGLFQPTKLEADAEREIGVLSEDSDVEIIDPDADGNGGDDGGSAGEAPEADLDDPDALLAAADAARGQEIFFANGCSVCHGSDGEGGIGPTVAQTGLSISQVVGQYRTPRGTMPPFDAGRVSDQDIADVYIWLQTLDLPASIVEGLGTP